MPPAQPWYSDRALDLAWKTVQSGTDLWYKEQYPLLYSAFDWSRSSYLKLIGQQARIAWLPSPPIRLQRAKPSGLTRTITFLDVPDQIIYQALAQHIARSAYPKLSQLYRKLTFSNLLLPPGNRDFRFFRDWRGEYRRFLGAQISAITKGNVFVATFDLASFYDVINHTQLVACLRSFFGVPDALLSDLERFLLRWSDPNEAHIRSQGIPQGVRGSALISECFIYQLDMIFDALVPGITYLRYGDDIRLFGPTKESVQTAMIALDIAIKSLGLIPQIAKVGVGPAGQIKPWTRSASQPGGAFNPITRTVSAAQHKQLRGEFLSCFKRTGFKRTTDATRIARFALYRMLPDRLVATRALHLLASDPYMSDAVHSYLRHTIIAGPESLARLVAVRLTRSLQLYSPYEWELGATLETLHYAKTRGGWPPISWVRNLINHWPPLSQSVARVQVMKWFVGLAKVRKQLIRRIDTQMDWYLSGYAIAMIFENSPIGTITTEFTQWMQSASRTTAMVAAYLAMKRGIRPPNLRLLSPWAGTAYRHHGYTRAVYKPRIVEELLYKLFRTRVPSAYSFEKKLGKRHYRAAARHLLQAEGSRFSNPSRFVTQVNNCNQLILAKLLPKVTGNNVPETAVFGRLEDLSKSGNKSLATIPLITTAFISCNRLRRRSPEPHAYAKDFGDVSRVVTPAQRKRLISELGAAYREVLTVL